MREHKTRRVAMPKSCSRSECGNTVDRQTETWFTYDMTNHHSTTDREVVMSQFSAIQPGLLPSGTVTELGAIVCSTLTAYEMADGSFVAFRSIHGQPAPVMPLVVLV